MHSQNYDIIGIDKPLLDKSHCWNAGMDGYQLFRKEITEVEISEVEVLHCT